MKAAGIRDFCIPPTPTECKISCIGVEEEEREETRGGGAEGPEKKAIDGGGILKTRNWRNDEFAEGRGEVERRWLRCTHSL